MTKVRLHLTTIAKFVTMCMTLIVAFVAACSPVPALASSAYLQQGMERIVQGGFPGAWAADSDGNTGAAGVADLQSGDPTQATMRQRVGSVTKAFTGATALQLVAEHRLRLDDTLDRWVPGILPYADSVTLRQLLSHTSGVPDYLEADSDSLIYKVARGEVSRYQTWTPRQLVALISEQPRHQLPANQAEYSDTNFILVGMIVEAVTHDTIQHQVQRRFIRPLHLTNTTFPATASTIGGNYAHGYSYRVDADGSPIVGQPLQQHTDDWTQYNPSFLWATGAIISNPHDLNVFMKALVGGRLLPPYLTAQMKTTVPITLPEGLFPAGFGAGLGIWSWDLQNVDVPDGCNQRIYGTEGEALGYDTWSFANAAGTKAISMGVNLMFPDWDAYYATELPAYASLWCSQ